jgi:hypothetical protein
MTAGQSPDAGNETGVSVGRAGGDRPEGIKFAIKVLTPILPVSCLLMRA